MTNKKAASLELERLDRKLFMLKMSYKTAVSKIIEDDKDDALSDMSSLLVDAIGIIESIICSKQQLSPTQGEVTEQKIKDLIDNYLTDNLPEKIDEYNSDLESGIHIEMSRSGEVELSGVK